MATKENILFKVSRTRLAAGAATVALTAGGIGVGVISAGASTADCTGITTGPLAGSCGDLVASSGYGLAVKAGNNGKAHLNDEIVGRKSVTTSGTTDFYAHQTNGNDNERVFEYAPLGKRSGLCISQTSAHAGLTLRDCNKNSAYQEFYGLGDTQNDPGNSNGGLQWLNAATGKVISISKTNVTMVDLASSSSDKGTYLNWK